MAYDYKKQFEPPPEDEASLSAPSGSTLASGDLRAGGSYVYADEIVLAVNVALATGRALLISGPPGSGKSSLAPSVAEIKKWRYYDHVITSRTQARDLLWHFDAVRRLSDAELGRVGRPNQAEGVAEVVPEKVREDLAQYIDPRELWWAINRDSAARRGLPPSSSLRWPATDLNRNPQAAPDARAVVLLDEIDKADPDVPNDLLVALGSFEFRIQELETAIGLPPGQPPPVVIITTNGERELPGAFVRRCVRLELERPKKPRLLDIARRRFGNEPERVQLYELLADLLEAQPQDAAGARPMAASRQSVASTAEYLDALSACIELRIVPDRNNALWRDLERSVLWKKRETVVTA